MHEGPAGTTRPEEGRLRALDGLRFAAAAAVVAFHYTGRQNPAWAESVEQVFPTLSRFTVYGGFGPYLFFMISGFVILMSAWGRPVHSFVASRVGRLFPAYWFAVVLIALVLVTHQWLFPGWGELGLPGAGLNLTMLQPAFGVGHVDGVFWTLWVELKFYVLVALVAAVGITRERVLLLCLVWPVLGAMAAQAHADLVVALLEPAYAPFFCTGILLYLVRREGWSAGTGLLLGGNLLMALWVCRSHFVPWTSAVAGADVSFRGTAVLFTLCVAALVVVTLTPVARLDWQWLSRLGALTYPLYLVHEIPGWALIHRLAPVLPAYVTLALVTLIMVGLAHLVVRFVERPLGSKLRRTVERDLGRALERSAAPVPLDATERRPTPRWAADGHAESAPATRRPPAPRRPSGAAVPPVPAAPPRRTEGSPVGR
ncbi:acyltransferase family protein [Geodermatophilus sp. SYSU D01186]